MPILGSSNSATNLKFSVLVKTLRKIFYIAFFSEAEMKVAIYCEIKSSLKSLRHFHKEKCLERNNKLYTDYCGNPSNKKVKISSSLDHVKNFGWLVDRLVD